MRLLPGSRVRRRPAQAQQLDVLITNARIVDGAPSPSWIGEIGIRAGRIAAPVGGQQEDAELDCGRGDRENRIKEQFSLFADRVSASGRALQ
jgi:hypothetical protein